MNLVEINQESCCYQNSDSHWNQSSPGQSHELVKPEPSGLSVRSGDLPDGTLHRTSRTAEFEDVCAELAKADVIYVGDAFASVRAVRQEAYWRWQRRHFQSSVPRKAEWRPGSHR